MDNIEQQQPEVQATTEEAKQPPIPEGNNEELATLIKQNEELLVKLKKIEDDKKQLEEANSQNTAQLNKEEQEKQELLNRLQNLEDYKVKTGIIATAEKCNFDVKGINHENLTPNELLVEVIKKHPASAKLPNLDNANQDQLKGIFTALQITRYESNDAKKAISGTVKAQGEKAEFKPFLKS